MRWAIGIAVGAGALSMGWADTAMGQAPAGGLNRAVGNATGRAQQGLNRAVDATARSTGLSGWSRSLSRPSSGLSRMDRGSPPWMPQSSRRSRGFSDTGSMSLAQRMGFHRDRTPSEATSQGNSLVAAFRNLHRGGAEAAPVRTAEPLGPRFLWFDLDPLNLMGRTQRPTANPNALRAVDRRGNMPAPPPAYGVRQAQFSLQPGRLPPTYPSPPPIPPDGPGFGPGGPDQPFCPVNPNSPFHPGGNKGLKTKPPVAKKVAWHERLRQLWPLTASQTESD